MSSHGSSETAVYIAPAQSDSATPDKPAVIYTQAAPAASTSEIPRLKCPNCSSENVQSLKVIFELGTSTIDATSSGSVTGFGVGTGAGVGLGVTSGTATGTQQTEAARQAAPPARKNFSEPGCLILMGGGAGLGALIAAKVSFLAAILGFLSCALCLLGGGKLIWKYQKWNNEAWPMLHDAWLRSWRCLKCGEVFEHQSRKR